MCVVLLLPVEQLLGITNPQFSPPVRWAIVWLVLFNIATLPLRLSGVMALSMQKGYWTAIEETLAELVVLAGLVGLKSARRKSGKCLPWWSQCLWQPVGFFFGFLSVYGSALTLRRVFATGRDKWSRTSCLMERPFLKADWANCLCCRLRISLLLERSAQSGCSPICYTVSAVL